MLRKLLSKIINVIVNAITNIQWLNYLIKTSIKKYMLVINGILTLLTWIFAVDNRYDIIEYIVYLLGILIITTSIHYIWENYIKDHNDNSVYENIPTLIKKLAKIT